MTSWQVFSGGTVHTLELAESVIGIDGETMAWADLSAIEYPTSFSVSFQMRESVDAPSALHDGTVGFGSAAELREFRTQIESLLASTPSAVAPETPLLPSVYTKIDPTRITSLESLPGFRTVRALGLISQLSATSGFTATMKGRDALSGATVAFVRSAAELGANAILGVSASPFGAGGGITSAFGGDAVGVLMVGTAVVVERVETHSDNEISRDGA